MIYDHRNVLIGCIVHDAESRARIDRVLSVDTDSGEVTVTSSPLRALANGQIATEVIRFRSIRPIRKGNAPPHEFQCSGRGETPFSAPTIPLS